MNIGAHRAKAIDAALGMTKTGKEQVGVCFELVENGERITWFGYFTDGTFERTIESLRYLGWTGTDLMDFRQGLPAGCDKEVEIVVDEEDDQNGNPRLKVRWVNGGGGVAVRDVLDETAARSFSARMKAKVAALQAAKGEKPAARKPTPTQAQGRAVVGAMKNAAGEPIAQDDIPF
jgi:hypothetical protein